ncbi:DUF484 family protein [Niveibacterium sp. SC-1]|uniref:DUF484 family protein n=1 Tax=Niveibacterium sp. SC-1 TaxID=3135646 RepID=UPI00311E643F
MNAPMNAQAVAAYLQEHPDFFETNAELLAHLEVPHPDTGEAISLTERQLMALREKLRLLQDKMAELVRFGEENDAISEKVHRMTLSLLEANSFESIQAVLDSHLVDDFEVPHIALRVWNSIISRESPEFSRVSEETRFFAADLRHPYCGPATQPEVVSWFGEAGAHVRSVALLPLKRDGQVFGLLALGSEDLERFYPEMGTLYVARIADLVSASLLNYLG